MRNQKSWQEMFAWATPIWGIPLLLALLSTLVWCIANRVGGLDFPIGALLSLSGDMLSILGIIVAILVAVITTVYVLSSNNQTTGFREFLRSVNRLRRLPYRIQDLGVEIVPTSSDGAPERLSDLTRQFIDRMNEITPGWGGYEIDPDLENEVNQYSQLSSNELINIQSSIPEGDTNMRTVESLWVRRDESLRGMVVGLLSMHLGAVGLRFAGRLIGLSLSLAVLLLLTLAIRTLSGLEDAGVLELSSQLMFFVFVLLPTATGMHIMGFALATYLWWRRVQVIRRAWQS